MKTWTKKLGLFMSMLILNICLTGIAPFFPGVADEKGFPTWLIGLVFSTAPFSSFLFSPFVPRLLEKFGRKFIIVTGTIVMALGKSTMAIMVITPLPIAIMLSFLGRTLVGLSYSSVFMTVYTTLTSDFPEETTRMIAIIEILAGIGLSIGPTFGAAAFAISGYIFACFCFAILNVVMVPVLVILMRDMRKYEIQNVEPISLMELIMKPVINKQKIFLDFCLQLLTMFSLSYLLPTLEFQLRKYNLSDTEIGFFYSIMTFAYLISSTIVSCLPSDWNKPRVMFFGVSFMAVGFAMCGPNEFIFPNSLVILAFGLALVGFACGFMYVPTMPHMLESAENRYGYIKDDRLYDSLSGITTASLCLGEVVGPTISSIIYDTFGFNASTDFACLLVAFTGINYGIFSDAFRRRNKNNILVKSVEPEEEFR